MLFERYEYELVRNIFKYVIFREYAILDEAKFSTSILKFFLVFVEPCFN